MLTTVEDILCGSTVWAINADVGESNGSDGRVELNEVTAGSSLRVFLSAFHSSGGHGSNDSRADAETSAEGLGEIPNLTDVDRDVGILGG